MRHTTIITGNQGSGKSMLARQFLKGEQKTIIEVDGIDGFKSNFKTYNDRVNYVIDEVFLGVKFKNFMRMIVHNNNISCNIVIVMSDAITKQYIDDNLMYFKGVTIIESIR